MNADTPFLAHLSTLAPSSADLEIRSLSSSSYEGDENEHLAFISALTMRLKQRRDYELVQTWMTVWLRLHGDLVASDPALHSALASWKSAQEDEGQRLRALVGWCAGVGAFLRGG